jgi:hypothetical protein
MLKNILVIWFAISLSIPLKAQQISKPDLANNPFSTVSFINSPIDTLSLMATYADNFGELGENNLGVLNSIHEIYGLNLKNINYAVAFKFDGCNQIFYMPCGDQTLFALLSAKQKISRFRLKCVVYRFYTIDGNINFFYIDKATVSNSI